MVLLGDAYQSDVLDAKVAVSDSEDNIFLMLPSISSLLSDIELEVNISRLINNFLIGRLTCLIYQFGPGSKGIVIGF